MLVDENGIAVRVDDHEAGGALARFVGFRRRRDASALQPPLQLAHVGERNERAW